MTSKKTCFEQRLETMRGFVDARIDGREEILATGHALAFVHDTLEACKFMAWAVFGEQASTQDMLEIYDRVVHRLYRHRPQPSEDLEAADEL